jgi:hypothetical protein
LTEAPGSRATGRRFPSIVDKEPVMFRKNLLRLLFWIGLLSSPLAAQAQAPPQYINASTCTFNNNVVGMYVVGPTCTDPAGRPTAT